MKNYSSKSHKGKVAYRTPSRVLATQSKKSRPQTKNGIHTPSTTNASHFRGRHT